MNIAVFASGNGSNFQAIADSIKNKKIRGAQLKLLLCDNPGAYVLERAKKARVETFLVERKNYATQEEFEAEIIKELDSRNIGLVVLAGFMRLLSAQFVKYYKNKILNIHPALLPAFKGTQAIKDAFDSGVKVTGVTVHFVDEEMDHGPIILQEAVKVAKGDTLESLEKKIHSVEHRIYPQAIQLFIRGKRFPKPPKIPLQPPNM